MSDLSPEVNKVLGALERISLLTQLSDMIGEYEHTCRLRCGNCQHWMKSPDCPAEYHDNRRGVQRGPSCEGFVCSKYLEKDDHTKFKNQKMNEAIAFAGKYGLPIPEGLKP